MEIPLNEFYSIDLGQNGILAMRNKIPKIFNKYCPEILKK